MKLELTDLDLRVAREIFPHLDQVLAIQDVRTAEIHVNTGGLTMVIAYGESGNPAITEVVEDE